MIKNLGIKTKRFYKLVLQGDDPSLNLWILFLIAIIIRLFFLPWIIDLPMAGDEENYWEWATDKFDLKYFFRPPLWPLLLHIPGLLFKHPLSGRILAMIIGAFSPLFVFLLARLLFNRRVGYLAGLIYAIYPAHVAYSHYLWAEILFGFIKRDYKKVAKIHLIAGLVLKNVSIDEFGQALRSIGEPIFGQSVKDISGGNLLKQLFEITEIGGNSVALIFDFVLSTKPGLILSNVSIK